MRHALGASESGPVETGKPDPWLRPCIQSHNCGNREPKYIIHSITLLLPLETSNHRAYTYGAAVVVFLGINVLPGWVVGVGRWQNFSEMVRSWIGLLTGICLDYLFHSPVWEVSAMVETPSFVP